METNNKLPDFKGKIVFLYISNAPRAIQDGVILEYAKFEMQGDRLFLVGRVPELDYEGVNWVSNLEAAVAWDKVIHYMVFKSREDYINRVKTAPADSFFQKVLGRQ